MSEPISGVEMYENLLVQKCGLKSVLIKEVELVDKELSRQDLFSKHKVPYDTIAGFSEGIDDAVAVHYGMSYDVKGWATNYIYNNELQTAIFIVANPEYSGPQLTGDDHINIVSIFKTITLLHELGHVHDIQNSINFDLSKKSIDLIAAEAYADIFALKTLKSWKHLYGKYALSLFSESLLERKNSSDFYQQVHTHIKKKVLESKLRIWSKLYK